MRREVLFEFDSPNRAKLIVEGFRFGEKREGVSTVAIVGALTGDAVSQLYVASKLVSFLKAKEEQNPGFIMGEILIIPSVNHFGLNMGQRHWPLDKTDINMMFPGYDKGETTQRIAHRLFEAVQGFDYGISLENRKDEADCIPYIKLFKSGYEDMDAARRFGFQFIHHKDMTSTDTVSLQYNWQIWKTSSFSLVFGKKNDIDHDNSMTVFNSVIRFLSKSGVIDMTTFKAYNTNIITRDNISVVKVLKAGIFLPKLKPGAFISKDQLLGYVLDSLDGSVKEKILSPCDGIITCIYNYSLINEHSIAFRIASIRDL